MILREESLAGVRQTSAGAGDEPVSADGGPRPRVYCIVSTSACSDAALLRLMHALVTLSRDTDRRPRLSSVVSVLPQPTGTAQRLSGDATRASPSRETFT